MLDKLKKIKNKLTLITLVIYLVTIIPNISMNIAQANTYGDGSAGDVTITNTRNLSSFSNKNFRNLTIDGGTLVVDQAATIYVQQTLTIKNNGRIISNNGANGVSGSIDGKNALDINISASNLIMSNNGKISSGSGGNTYSTAYYDEDWALKNGGKGGSVNLTINSLTMNNSSITTGNGGNIVRARQSSYTYLHYGEGTCYAGDAGNININGSGATIILENNSYLKTGIGGNGFNQRTRIPKTYPSVNRTGDKAGKGGNIYINGINNIDVRSTSYIESGKGGNGGHFLTENNLWLNNPDAGHGGDITINASFLIISGQIKLGFGGDGGTSEGHSYDDSYYYALAPAGGDGGKLTINASNVTVNGSIIGGNGGIGGTPAGAFSQSGFGGRGSDININSDLLILNKENSIISGNGGDEGHTKPYTWGNNGYTTGYANRGDRGRGGNITINSDLQINADFALKSGSGSNLFNVLVWNSSSGYGIYSRKGGKGGSIFITFKSPDITLNRKLANIGGGGSIYKNDSNSYYSGILYLTSAGDTGNVVLNCSGNLTLSVDDLIYINRPGEGLGQILDKYSPNGSLGWVTFNVGKKLTINNRIINTDVTSFNSKYSENSSQIYIKCKEFEVNTNKISYWGNENNGKVILELDLDKLAYSHNFLKPKFKQDGLNMDKFIYKLNHNSIQDIFVGIPQDHFQVSQDVSFNLEETLYNKILFLFANVKRFKSEDNGTNWQEIITTPMSRDWTWNAPATVKGNSRLKIGIIPYGYSSPEIQEVWINGKQLNTFWTPTQTNPPVIVSNTFAILDTDVGAPVVTLDVNKGETLTTNKILNLNIFAVDNVTPAHILKYSVSHNDGKGVENIPYSQISNYQYDLGKYYTNNQPPSGFYKITVKVIDENFNTGVASKTIYYLRPEDVPATPQPANTVSGNNPNGFALREKSGAEIVGQIKDNKLIYNANKNTLELDLTANTNPYYQVRIGESDFGRIYNKTDVRKLNLPPGEGYHLVGIRSLTADKAPGEETEFYVIVDNTPPVVDISVNNKASIITGDSVQLTIKAKDNIYSQDELVYSYDKSTWQPIPANGTITRSLAATGLVTITVYVKDPSGNIGEAIIKIWKKTRE